MKNVLVKILDNRSLLLALDYLYRITYFGLTADSERRAVSKASTLLF
jgi:hypothetical protein